MSGPIAASSQIAEGDMLRVVGTREGDLVLVRVEGRIHALRDRCPHAAALLSEGFVDGRRLVCPTHFAAFDVVTGEARDAPPGCPAAKAFSIVERDDGLFLA